MKKCAEAILLSLLIFFSCSPSPEIQAEKIISSSIFYHDPGSSWENLERLAVEKQQINYDSEGLKINEITFLQEFRLNPYFEAKSVWQKDSIVHKVVFDGLMVSYMMGVNEVHNEGFLSSKRAELELGYHDLVMPMIISSLSKSSMYQNKASLSDNREAEVVRMEMKDSKIIDLYFLPESHQLIAYMQRVRNEFEVVNTVEMQDYKGIYFPAKKEVFAADSLGNHYYLKSKISYRFLN